MSYVIAGTEAGAVNFTPEEFEISTRQRWGDALEGFGVEGDGLLTASIQPATEPPFSIRLDRQGEGMSTDGTPEQVAEVAAWARSLLPADIPGEVWVADFMGHAALPWGVEKEDVWAGWSET